MPVLLSTIITMENKLNIVDIHCHILFEIDDGAQSLEESIEMAKMWLAQGVDTVVATPHFDLRKDDLDTFINNRDSSVKRLRSELEKQGLPLRVLTSAELYFRPDLVQTDLTPFLIEDTNYLVIELPTRSVPPRIKSTFEALILQGYNPILVHIERYPALKQDLTLFYELVDMGVVCQVNAETIINTHDSFIKAAIKKNHVHLVGSDAHRADRRKPNITEGLHLSGHLEAFNGNAIDIINNKLINTNPTARIKKIFNKYY